MTEHDDTESRNQRNIQNAHNAELSKARKNRAVYNVLGGAALAAGIVSGAAAGYGQAASGVHKAAEKFDEQNGNYADADWHEDVADAWSTYRNLAVGGTVAEFGMSALALYRGRKMGTYVTQLEATVPGLGNPPAPEDVMAQSIPTVSPTDLPR